MHGIDRPAEVARPRCAAKRPAAVPTDSAGDHEGRPYGVSGPLERTGRTLDGSTSPTVVVLDLVGLVGLVAGAAVAVVVIVVEEDAAAEQAGAQHQKQQSDQTHAESPHEALPGPRRS